MKRTFYEDYAIGDEFITPARTVTETDVAMFAALSGDYNRLHTDAEYAGQGPFGERIAHGLLGLSMVVGLAYRTEIDPDGAVAFLGLSWKFSAPIKFGDTIHAVIRITGMRETRRPDRGTIVQAIRLLNQRGGIVQEGEFTMMLKRRPESSEFNVQS
jgi:acyl dehydratase